ncbi:hypothetical protein GS429_20275 [Natronorubrum sp. JWXQ-INN-674]|uniref:DUF7961 domain-containing protein n=1 Tax=Natronorubrum halalkaliphilum TaxID=2691917 RepID=A0A6B0VR96_9EURY|nr:hypothetical protein [Natronorubrum halalkaliphilum]MXV64361.1 hypothetical protein [Natronorubrum halalkaliphilum]
MSTTSPTDAEPAIDGCQPADVTPVTLEAETLESTAPGLLRDFKRELTEQGLFPAELTVETCFDEDCSLATQDEIDRVRGYVRAGSFLGVGTVTVRVDDVADPEKVRPALAACAERAEREGLALELEGAITLES